MKKRLMLALVALLCAVTAGAAAQALPSVEVFSPGLVRVSEKLAQGERVEMTAQMTAEDIFYARDLSLLGQMLSGTTFCYSGGGSLAQGSDALTLMRGEEALLSLALLRGEGGAQLCLDGDAYALDLSAVQGTMGLGDTLYGVPVLERVPLTTVCTAIESLRAGDVLLGGLTIRQAFDVKRTMSDDGTRLTRIDIEGSVSLGDGEPWTISGYLRQPAGTSPKDTFELTAVQDDRNQLTLSYSSTRKSTVTRKNKAGEMDVDTTLRAEGEIGGYGVETRLTVYLRNAWTADGEALNEKVTVSATLGHTDRTPGRQMQRLNDLSIKLRTVMTLTTNETENPVIDVGGQTTLTAVFDGNTFLDTAASTQTAVGGEAEAVQLAPAPAPQTQIAGALSDAVIRLARELYAQLGDSARQKIGAGL